MAEDDETFQPGMIIVALVPNEPALARRCPDCHKQYKAHDEVFVSVDEAVMIHVSCVVALALIASMRNVGPATLNAAYEHSRQQVLDAAPRSDG